MEKDKYLIGRKPVLDALNAQDQIEKVWIDNTLKGDIEQEIRHLTRKLRVPLQYVPKSKLNGIVKNSNHQGLVAQISVVEYITIEDVLPHIFESGRTPRILVLDGIEDVRNIGALARTAVWFDFDAMLIAIKRSARLNSFAYKSSAGALKDITVCRENSMTKAIEYMKQSGLKIIVAGMDGHSDWSGPLLKGPMALVLGSEEKGVVREVEAMADEIITIPGSNRMESLNVSVAGAILMHEVYRINNL